MPTANFNLPLIDAGSPISIVNDMNALATATDSAMTQFSTAGSLDAIRTLANNANTVANQANTTAEAAQSTANAAATEATAANSAAQSANALAATANTNANSAISQAQQANADLRNYFNFHVHSRYTPSWAGTNTLTLVFNADKTLFKLYGKVKTSTSVTESLIPGYTATYGLKVSSNSPFGSVSTPYIINGLGVVSTLATISGTSVTKELHSARVGIGTDGNIYLDPTNRSSAYTYSANQAEYVYTACLLVNANYGDEGGNVSPDE